MPHDPLLAEIDDDLRRERMRRLAKSLGSYVLAFSVVVLLGTIGIVVWKQHQTGIAEKLTGLLIEADMDIKQNRMNEATPLLKEVIAANHPTISPLARLWLAQLAKPAHPADTVEVLAPLLARTRPDAFRQYARMIEGDPATFINLPDAALTGAFGLTLREERAVALFQAGRKAEAAKDFRVIANDPATQESMRGRALLLLQTLLRDSATPPSAPNS